MINRIIVISLLVFIPIISFAQNKLLSIEDATGTIVGVVFGTPRTFENTLNIMGSASTVIDIDGTFYPVRIRRDRIVGALRVLKYQSSDCSGTPYFSKGRTELTMADPVNIVAPSNINTDPDDMTLFVPDTTDVNLTFNSFYDARFNTCVNFPNNVDDGLEAIPVADLDTMYTPPFRIKVAKKKKGKPN